MRVALIHEHPTWSAALLERLRERAVVTVPVDVGELRLRLPELDVACDLWINRVNAMPSAGRSPSVVAATAHFLLSLELRGQRVINGWRTYQTGASKSAQAALFGQAGLSTPDGIGVHRLVDVADAAAALGFPVLTKPNIGGSGMHIVLHEDADQLDRALAQGSVDLGIDGTAVVQRVIQSADDIVYRVEMLGDELFYATRQPMQAGAFNYCAADGCGTDAMSTAIELYDPDPHLVEAVGRVMRGAEADVGGVEYLIDATTGEPCFFDFNPYSNFVTGYEDQLGFDPIDRYLDHVLRTP